MNKIQGQSMWGTSWTKGKCKTFFPLVHPLSPVSIMPTALHIRAISKFYLKEGTVEEARETSKEAAIFRK